MKNKLFAITIAFILAGAPAAAAQSAAGFAGDPNAETNQIPSPSNTQPADPGAGSYTEARTPTDPQKRDDSQTPGRIYLGPDEPIMPSETTVVVEPAPPQYE
jgi:hypothetical protein